MSWFRLRVWGIVTWVTLSLFVPVWADDDTVVFAVVSDVPKDRSRVSAKALLDGAVSDLKLLPGELILGNPVWRTLEVCHALKLEGMKIGDGFKVTSARVLDASMLPMALQGYAGDCLIKKAVEIAPLAD
ncbi:MAG: hypothetical protein WBC46_16040 [Nitrospira sp.]|jgi:hypothetical protein|nr:hypothetical protein [Nitrospira sp.]MBP6206507.1 hypothetical protein [Nitrospira sp.]MBP8825835.1 hypothetical protein [Nitrospira sp.]HNP81837.1 hypothetical protein [Nitrospira sp.]